MNWLSCATCVATIAIASSGAAQTTSEFLIDFEMTSAGDPIPDGATLIDQYADMGVMFTSSDPAGPEIVCFGFPGQSGVNTMQGGQGYEGKFALIDIALEMEISYASILALDVGQGGLAMKAWNAAGELVDCDMVVNEWAGFGEYDVLQVEGEGIVLIELRRVDPTWEYWDGYWVDDLRVRTGSAPEQIMKYGRRLDIVGGGGNPQQPDLVRLSYTALDAVEPPFDAYEDVHRWHFDPDTTLRPLITVYSGEFGPDVWTFDGSFHGARDIFIQRSADDGQTWTAATNLSDTAYLTSINAVHTVDTRAFAEPFYGDSTGHRIFTSGPNVLVTWLDTYVPSLVQRSAVYPEYGYVEVPYSAVYAVRSTDGGVTWSTPQLISDGLRDAQLPTAFGNDEGWIIVWQEDPQGLPPVPPEPDPFDNGLDQRKVGRGTDIWFTSLALDMFRAGDPFPTPERVSDNFTVGEVGAEAAQVTLVGDQAVVAYEETKEHLDLTKFVRYHVFSAFDDTMPDPTGGMGWIISEANQHAADVQIQTQATPGAATGVQFLICFMQTSAYVGPCGIAGRLGFDGFLPGNLYPAVRPNPVDRAEAMLNDPCLQMSHTDAASALEDTQTPSAVLRGDRVAVGYIWTADWEQARYGDPKYDFFVRCSSDGGATWAEPFNVTRLSYPDRSVFEGRLVGTLIGDAQDLQNPNVFFAGWTEGRPASTYRNMKMTRTVDGGASFEPIQSFGYKTTPCTVISGTGNEAFGIWTAYEQLRFLSGQAIERMPGDVDLDFAVDGDDLEEIIDNMGRGWLSLADLNHDNWVDVDDLQIVLDNWNP